MDFLDELETKIIPGDGAMGTLLLEAGIPLTQCFEELCVSNSDLIRSFHDAYLAVGARVLKTNSFGANAVRLEKFGLGNRVNEINWSAAQLARSCARGKNVYVAGSVGPTGLTAVQAKERGIDQRGVFQEQLGALLDGGVDLIFFETFTDLEELALALHVKQSLHHCPAICSVACNPEGRLASGLPVDEAFRKLRGLDAEVVGLNCIDGPAMGRFFQQNASEDLKSAYPNAGLPNEIEGRLFYELAPDDFAQSARDLAAAGARLIGGCCGVGPRHIAAMVAALEGFPA